MNQQRFDRVVLQRCWHLVLACSGFLTLGTVSPVHAQQEARGGLEEIVVTARRRDESLNEAPVAITALSEKTLDRYNVTNFTDIGAQVPSLVLGRAASGTSASIFLRGVGSTSLSGGFDQSVSIIIDNVPMSRGREILLSQFDVSMIEVLKGPQALFFGKNTTGGLISVTTNGPSDEFEAGFKVGHGFEADEFYGEGFVSGPLSETLKARLAFRAGDSDGMFANSAQSVSLDPLGREIYSTGDRGGYESKSARLTVDWDPADSFSLTAKLGVSQYDDGGSTDTLERICGQGRTVPATSNGIPPSPNSDCRVNGVADFVTIPREVAATLDYYGNGEPYADFDSVYASVDMEFVVGNLDVNSITSFYDFEQTDLSNVGGESYPATFSQLADFDQFSQELRFNTNWDGPLNLMFGGFYSDEKFLFISDVYIFPVPADPFTGTFRTFYRDTGFEASTLSFFVEGTYNLAENWELSGGARWSRVERDSYQQAQPGHIAFAAAFPGDIRLEDDFDDTNVSPQLTLRWLASDSTTLYASYKAGFKSGGFNLSQTLIPTASVQAGQYGSEEAEGFEVGLRSIFNNELRLNVTAYNYDIDDLQVQKFDPVTIGQVVDNVGTLNTKGIELELDYVPSSVPGLNLRAAIAYNDAEFQDYVGECYGGQTIAEGCSLVASPGGAFTSQDYEGRTPPKAPELAARLGFTYAWDLNAYELSLSADWSYSDEYNFTETLRPDAIQDSFTKYDAAISLVSPEGNWSVALIGRNLGDELVVTGGADIPFTGGVGTGTTTGIRSDLSPQVLPGREVYLEATYSF